MLRDCTYLELVVDLGVLPVGDLNAVLVVLHDLELDGAPDAEAGVVGGQLWQPGQHAALILKGVVRAGLEQALMLLLPRLGRSREAYKGG